MAHIEAEVTGVAGEVAVQPPRRPRLLATLERVLGLAVEIPAAVLVVAEIVILFAGVVARYGVHRPLIWSDELASILFLWLAMLGAAGAFPPPPPPPLAPVCPHAPAPPPPPPPPF